MKVCVIAAVLLLGLIAAACQPSEPACPPGTLTYQDSVSTFPPADPASSAEQLEVDGKLITFDQVIHGPLCNNRLQGTVYVACDIVIPAWSGTPNFLDSCEFVVEPGAVIYVAAHNDAVYYKGCGSCHQSDANNSP